MSHEPSDSPDAQQQGGPGPFGPASAGLAPEGAALSGTLGAAVSPDLLVRSQGANRLLHGWKTYRVGRDPESDIEVPDPRVSWQHAVLRVDGGAWVLEDSGSTNGTYLGPQRRDRVEITAQCEVRLGDQDSGPILRLLPQLPTIAADVVSVAQAAGTAAPPPGHGTAGSFQEDLAGSFPEDPAPRERRTSVDSRPTALTQLQAAALRIGRTPDNDLVLEDLGVSRRHAELRKTPDGRYLIADLGSHNGTFVNGRRITAHLLTEDDIIGIGHSSFRLAGDELRHHVDQGAVTFSAHNLVVAVSGGKVLLDHVTIGVPEKCLVGVIGPSGAGKSTLLGALTGTRPADSGTVLYDNRDLYQHYDELRHRIGLVPQENILHTQLTARRALRYAAELRFPADTRAAEREARIDEVMAELGLAAHAETRADRLSGGQLKRVNVAQELLTRPSLLFLDEPTSGLDPGLDKSVMRQLRELAHDGGRTIIVVTHSVANLDTCDRLLVLAPGGKVAFYGPPDEGLRYFDVPDWAEVFQAIDRYPERDWASEFAASPYHAQYVAATEAPEAAGARQQAPPSAPRRRGGLRQVATLTRRYTRVIASDRGYLLFMGLLPVVLGLLIHFVPAKGGLSGVPGTRLTAQELLQIMVTCACLAGTAASVREVVKERAIYIRERAAGLSAAGYLLSKLLVLGMVSLAQSAVIVLLGLAGREMPRSGAALAGLPLLELLLSVAVLALASMCLGLLVSSMVNTSEKAMPFLVMLTMAQVILSGGVLPLGGIAGLSQLSWIAPARWGFGAAAATVNLNVLTPITTSADPLWRHTSGNWLRDMGFMAGLAAVFLLLTWVRLRRLGPRRRSRRLARRPA